MEDYHALMIYGISAMVILIVVLITANFIETLELEKCNKCKICDTSRHSEKINEYVDENYLTGVRTPQRHTKYRCNLCKNVWTVTTPETTD